MCGVGGIQHSVSHGSSEAATKQLLEEAEQIFEQCYAQYSELYSPSHLEAIKCITMMGLVFRKLDRWHDALEWCRKEVTSQRH